MIERSIEERDSGAPSARIARRWSAALEDFFRRRNEALAPLLALYDERVRFEDPVHSIDGIAAFAEMNRRFAERSRELAIDVTDVAGEGDVFFAAWTMRLAPRLGPRMTMAGATLARVRGDKIVYQRDNFDPVGGFARAIPGVSIIYRGLVGIMS